MARRFEIELDNHRSRYLTDEMAQSATAILVFDNSNVEAIAQRFPELSNRIIRLGLLVPDSDMPWSIDDPYGGDEQSYERAYRHIAAAVDGLYALIAKEAW